MQSEITTKQAQIDILREQYNILNLKINEATIAEQKAMNDALSASIERDAAQRKSETYEKEIINLQIIGIFEELNLKIAFPARTL